MTDLVDMGVLRALARGPEDPRLEAWARSRRRIAVSAITYAEFLCALERWSQGSERSSARASESPDPRQNLTQWLTRFSSEYLEILPFTPALAALAAQVFHRARVLSRPLAFHDALTCATALAEGRVLWTFSESVAVAVPDLQVRSPVAAEI